MYAALAILRAQLPPFPLASLDAAPAFASKQYIPESSIATWPPPVRHTINATGSMPAVEYCTMPCSKEEP